MISRAAEWHPLNDRVFASSGGNRVELFEIQNHERNGAILRAFVETQHPISCFQWGLSSTNNPSHQSLPLLALGSSSGNISLADWNRNSEVFVYEAGSRRPCTGVGWSKHRPEQLAAGFEKGMIHSSKHSIPTYQLPSPLNPLSFPSSLTPLLNTIHFPSHVIISSPSST